MKRALLLLCLGLAGCGAGAGAAGIIGSSALSGADYGYRPPAYMVSTGPTTAAPTAGFAPMNLPQAPIQQPANCYRTMTGFTCF